eukprot:Skav228021  [mRNA]  locus=scaffold1073:153214:153569:+ [translate_table: standard]
MCCGITTISRMEHLQLEVGSRPAQICPQESYLKQLLESEEEEPIWVIYTNKNSLLGPMLRHPMLADRAEKMQLLNMPYLTKQAWLACP